jgi:hypothetical protein
MLKVEEELAKEKMMKRKMECQEEVREFNVNNSEKIC